MKKILRDELEPNIKKAEKSFLQVLTLISKFDIVVDKGDENKMAHVISQLNEVTGKCITKDDLHEYWGYTSIESLAFDISLPSPSKVENITTMEIVEIKIRLEKLIEQEQSYFEKLSEKLVDQGVSMVDGLEEYYRDLLDRNVPPSPDKVIYL